MVETEKPETHAGQDCPEELAASVDQVKRLLHGIQAGIDGLREVLLTEEEWKEIKKIQEEFDQKMQGAVYTTHNNLNSYRQDGWKQLICKGEDDDE